MTKTKDCLGKRSLSREDTARIDRKQLVGLLADDPQCVLAEGAQILDAAPTGPTAPMVGHVTSSYHSPTLGRSIAMGLVKGGHHRMGERVHVSMQGGRLATATIASPVFFDPNAERQHA